MKKIQKIDDSVLNFVNDIIAEIKNSKFTTEVDTNYIDAESKCGGYKSISCSITTDYGMIVVFPNFNTNSASAAIYNIGAIKRDESEGFNDEFITEKTKSWSSVLGYTENSVKTLAYYLTTKINT